MKTLLLAILLCAIAPQTMRAETPDTETRFLAVDVQIDPQGTPLAAYQVEVTGESDRVKLVGVEGGSGESFGDAPYYDPAALTRHRVILAALSLSDDLPTDRTRVARLHLEIIGPTKPDLTARVIVAGDRDGQPISATVTLVPVEGDPQ